MPVASPDQYLEMLDRAKKGGFAYPAINVSSTQTLNAALAGLVEAGSDGIIQVTTGGGDYWSGPTVKKMSDGAIAMATVARELAKNYGITDNCDVVIKVIASMPGLICDMEAAQEKMKQAAKLQEEASAEIREVVRQMRDQGLTMRDIAVLLGVTPQRIAQLTSQD